MSTSESAEVVPGSRLPVAKRWLGAYRQAEALGLSPAVLATIRQRVVAVYGASPTTAIIPRTSRSWQELAALWEHEGSWQERLSLLGELFALAVEAGGADEELLAWLNRCLADLSSWYPLDAEALGELGNLLRSFARLESQLPSLWHYHIGHTQRFYSSFIESGLWAGFIGVPSPRGGMLSYLRGVAELHVYVLKQRTNLGSLLVQAELSIAAAQRSGLAASQLPHWDRLVVWALGVVEQSSELGRDLRRKLMVQLKVARGSDDLDLDDLQAYVDHVYDAQLSYLTRLLTRVRDLAAAGEARKDLERKLVWSIAHATHLVTDDLQQLWQMANVSQHRDLAWRVATVAERRQVLGVYSQRLWQISGEYRRTYPQLSPDEEGINACLSGFSPDEAHLVRGLALVGGAFPYLASEALSLTIIRHGFFTKARSPSPVSPLVSCLVHPLWRRLSYVLPEGRNVHPFTAEESASEWRSLLEQLLYVLGFPAWGWSMATLSRVTTQVVPKRHHSWHNFYRQLFTGSERLAANWQRSLSSEQRQAWHQIMQLASRIPEERARDVLFGFACRLTTTIFPHNHQALTSLQAMGAPLRYLWDFETWLVSDSYSQWRAKRGLALEMPIPEYLQKQL